VLILIHEKQNFEFLLVIQIEIASQSELLRHEYSVLHEYGITCVCSD